jgi:hypothetical protein
MKIISFIEEESLIKKILKHQNLWLDDFQRTFPVYLLTFYRWTFNNNLSNIVIILYYYFL